MPIDRSIDSFASLISCLSLHWQGLLGLFFFVETGVLFPDIMSKELSERDSGRRFVKAVSEKYHSCAYNCWIAAALYVVTLVVALWQNKWNRAGPLA